MKTISLIAILVIVSSAMTVKEQRLKAMNKITYTSLFTEIQSQITSGGPLTAILDTIAKFLDQVKAEENQHSAMWTIQDNNCKDEFKFRKGEIDLAADTYTKAKKQFDICTLSLKRAKNDREQNKKD